MTAREVFHQSDGSVTTAFYKSLQKRGTVGRISLLLFRAEKAATRAEHSTDDYRRLALETKNKSLKSLVAILMEHGGALGINWGWRSASGAFFNAMALYIDIPNQGQCRFLAPQRYAGPSYAGTPESKDLSMERITAFCDAVLMEDPVGQERLAV